MALVRPTPPPFVWAADLFTVGVTGTNGKTSTTHLLAAALATTGDPTLTVGTVGYFLRDEKLDLPRTLASFHTAMERLHGEGGRFAAVEVTSRALAEGFAKRWRFDLGVFTNLSPDHLTTHGSWEHYLASKAQLFVHLGPGATAVLNASDRHARFLDQAIPPDVERVWFSSPTRGPAGVPADLAAATVEVDAGGTRIVLADSEMAASLGGSLSIRMVGDVFAENALAAAAAAVRAGIAPERVAAGLAACPPVPGRFEVLGRDPTIVVDYAHTPDALERTLRTARSIASGRVLVVFGAGGGATPDKRGPMGEAVGRGADRILVTNDNPRHEDPRRIAEALVAGVRRAGGPTAQIVFDRRRAIETAIAEADADDIVVIAGKGHETGQQIGETTHPFSDRDEVLSEPRSGGGATDPQTAARSDVLATTAAAIDAVRRELVTRYGWTHVEVAARLDREAVALVGTVVADRVVHVLRERVAAAVPDRPVNVEGVTSMAGTGWYALAPGVHRLFARHDAGTSGWGAFIEWTPEDAPVERLAEVRPATLVRGRDATVGWLHEGLAGTTTPRPLTAPRQTTPEPFVAQTRAWRGRPYVLGGSTPAGIDCSALVQRAAAKSLGIVVPRNSGDQLQIDPRPGPGPGGVGDLQFVWNEREALCHVGVCAGDTVVHASRSRGAVVEDRRDAFGRGCRRAMHLPFASLVAFGDRVAGAESLRAAGFELGRR